MNNFQERTLNDSAKAGLKALGGFFEFLDNKLQENGWYDKYENVTIGELNNEKIIEMIKDAQE